MKKKPTFEEVQQLSTRKKPLYELCHDHGIDFKESDNIVELKRLLIEGLNLKEGPEAQNFSETPRLAIELPFGNSDLDHVTKDQNKINQEPNSEKRSEEISLSVDSNSFATYQLPVTLDELVQYWQRGFICHPAVLAHLTGGSNIEHRKSDISKFSSIDLEKVYPTECNIALEMDKAHIKSASLNQKWIVPITVLKSIRVRSEEEEEIVIRSLRNTNRGFKEEGIQIMVVRDRPENQTDNNNIGPIELSEETKKEFHKLDSLMGGFAISSYIEREELLNGKHFSTSISRFGSLFEGVFLLPKKKYKKKLLDFIIEKMKANLSIGTVNNSNYFDELLDALSVQNDELIMERVIEHNRSRIGSAQISELQDALQENFVTKIIEEIIIKGSRDPFLIFISLLNQFSNTKVPAASDKQSFLFAIQDFNKEGKLDQEESIIVAFLLGYYLGYGKCWNPKDAEVNEWSDGTSILKLLYAPVVLQSLLEKLIGATKLDYQFSEGIKFGIKNKEIQLSSSISNTRSIKVADNQISLNDRCLDTFLKWRDQTKNVTVLNLFLYHRENEDLESQMRALFKSKDEKSQIFQRIERDLTRGKFSDSEREAVCKIIESH